MLDNSGEGAGGPQSRCNVLIIAPHRLADEAELKLATILEKRGARLSLRYTGYGFTPSTLNAELTSKDGPITHAIFFLDRPSYMLHEKDVLREVRRASNAKTGFICMHTDQSLKELGEWVQAGNIDFVVVTGYSDHARVRNDWRPGNSMVSENIAAEIEAIADTFLGKIMPRQNTAVWA